MKFIAYFFLSVFLTFIALPLLVKLVEQSDELITIAAAEEEDNMNNILEVQQDFIIDQFAVFKFTFSIITNITPDHISNTTYSLVYIDPISPPPRIV